MEAANRRLIRPSLNELKERIEAKKGLTPPIKPPTKTPPPQQQPPHSNGPNALAAKKSSPSESTNAENFYYAKQISNKTPMVVVLKDGEQVQGVIEWYDKHCLRVDRGEDPGAMIYKQNIKYMYKAD
ncbi:MAG: RNA chaperone Hfq [Bryobacteraceae bacterium]